MVHIVERGTCPSGPLMRVEGVEMWRKVGGTDFFFLISCVHRGEFERASPCSQLLDMGDGHSKVLLKWF